MSRIDRPPVGNQVFVPPEFSLFLWRQNLSSGLHGFESEQPRFLIRRKVHATWVFRVERCAMHYQVFEQVHQRLLVFSKPVTLVLLGSEQLIELLLLLRSQVDEAWVICIYWRTILKLVEQIIELLVFFCSQWVICLFALSPGGLRFYDRDEKRSADCKEENFARRFRCTFILDSTHFILSS